MNFNNKYESEYDMNSGEMMPANALEYFKNKMKRSTYLTIILSLAIIFIIGMFIINVAAVLSFEIEIDGQETTLSNILASKDIMNMFFETLKENNDYMFLVILAIVAFIIIITIILHIKIFIISILQLRAINNNQFEYKIGQISELKTVRNNKSTRRYVIIKNIQCIILTMHDYYKLEIGKDCYVCKINSPGCRNKYYAFPVNFNND